jgi:hypothetical protein
MDEMVRDLLIGGGIVAVCTTIALVIGLAFGKAAKR